MLSGFKNPFEAETINTADDPERRVKLSAILLGFPLHRNAYVARVGSRAAARPWKLQVSGFTQHRLALGAQEVLYMHPQRSFRVLSSPDRYQRKLVSCNVFPWARVCRPCIWVH